MLLLLSENTHVPNVALATAEFLLLLSIAAYCTGGWSLS